MITAQVGCKSRTQPDPIAVYLAQQVCGSHSVETTWENFQNKPGDWWSLVDHLGEVSGDRFPAPSPP